MPNTTRQYRPVAAEMTAANAPLSVRTVQTMADNLNNYSLYVGNHKLIGQPCIPEWVSHDSTTDERVILPFSHRTVPFGFDALLVVLRHYRREGSGSTTWRLYCSRSPYRGPVIMDAEFLGQNYTSCSVVTSSGDLSRSTATLRIVRGMHGNDKTACWFVLTAQNGDASTRSALTSIDVWPHTATIESERTV